MDGPYSTKMKTKAEIINELNAHSYTHEFVLNNLSESNKRKLIEFLFKEKEFSKNPLFDISTRSFKKVAVLVYNKEGNIVALTGLEKTLIPHLDIHMFEFSCYVGKKFRVKGIRSCIVYKLSYPLSYYESQEYTKSQGMSEIRGLHLSIENSKIISKHMKTESSFYDDYWSMTHLKDRCYVWYYEM
jgi:hypothetical protein